MSTESWDAHESGAGRSFALTVRDSDGTVLYRVACQSTSRRLREAFEIVCSDAAEALEPGEKA